MLLEVLYLYL